MKHTCGLMLCVGLLLLCSGCGHNGFAYSNGDYWNVGYNPQTNAIGVQRINGEQVMVGNRENTNLEMEMTENIGITVDGKSGAKNSRISKIKYQVGIQINGYTVELAQNNPEFAAVLLSHMAKQGMASKYYIVKDGKLQEVTREQYNAAEVGTSRTQLDPITRQVTSDVVKTK